MATAEDPVSEKKQIVPTTSVSEARIEAEKDAHGSPEEQLSQDSHSDKKRDDGCKHCSCKKSRCLKLYCVCFAAGTFCSEPCACRLCFNKPIYGETVQSTRKEIWLRKQVALPVKVVRTLEAGQEVGEEVKRSPALIQLRRGCNCKKSSCLKKYCDCYQGGIGCSKYCRCEDCKNVFGRKVEGGINLTLNRWNSANLVHSEDEEHDAGGECSPHCRSPISRESSFQQETPDIIGTVMMDGQLQPQPVAQLQPQQWHCLKRHREDRFADGMEGYTECKTQRDVQLPKREDKYTISRCIEVMNGIAELSPLEKSLAPDIFVEPSNREIFLSLGVDIRTMWLRRKIKLVM